MSREKLIETYGRINHKSIDITEALDQMLGFAPCCDDEEQDDILLEPWLWEKIDKSGLLGEYLYAARAGGCDGVLKFLRLHGLADKGGYTDTREQS